MVQQGDSISILSPVTENNERVVTYNASPNEGDIILKEPPIFAVHCGGSAYIDKAGIAYQSDTYFSGGRTRGTTSSIAGTEDDALYQSERYGNFSYNIPLSNGSYWVTLKFADAIGEILTAGPIKGDIPLPFRHYI